MNHIRKYMMTVACAAAMLPSFTACDKEAEGAGDAKIGFEKTSYTFKESAGIVKVKVSVTGEPKKYPVTFDVTAKSVEGDTLSTLLKFTQSEGLKYVGNEDAPAYVEFTLVDNEVINDTKHVELTITNVSGAELVADNAVTVINIADNDNNPYDRLMGNWKFSGTSISNGKTSSFSVNISGGFTEKEQEANANKVLVCWGWENLQHDYTDDGFDPGHFAAWYIDYDEDTEKLSVEVGTKMVDYGLLDFSPSVPGSKFALYSASLVNNAFSVEQSIPATFSEDFNTITFNPDYGFGALIYADGDWSKYYYSAYYDIVLTRVQ